MGPTGSSGDGSNCYVWDWNNYREIEARVSQGYFKEPTSQDLPQACADIWAHRIPGYLRYTKIYQVTCELLISQLSISCLLFEPRTPRAEYHKQREQTKDDRNPDSSARRMSLMLCNLPQHRGAKIERYESPRIPQVNSVPGLKSLGRRDRDTKRYRYTTPPLGNPDFLANAVLTLTALLCSFGEVRMSWESSTAS